MTVKTDDVTMGRKDLDPHGRFRGEWVNREKFRLMFTANRSLKFGISLEEYLKCIPNHNELVLAPFNPIPIILQKAVPGI